MAAIIDQIINETYAIYNADCMAVLPTLRPESLGFSVYSPPFPELYQYSNDPRDMSNCTSFEEGMAQYRFVVEEIHRATMPGRLTAVHCMDLKRGQYQRDFPGEIIKTHEAAGFNFYSRITIWKDPWLIARRTRMRSLTHKMIVKDSAVCHPAGPDYVLVFRKGGDNAVPIVHPFGLSTYPGGTSIPEHLVRQFANFEGDQRKNRLSHWIWRKIASPVWDDIRSGRLLPYREARESEEEKHVCPLQLDVIERCLTLWSNPGDVVLTPFLGVGSEAYCAVKMGRKAVGIELKPTYFKQAVRNVESALHSFSTGEENDLFTGAEPEAPEDGDDEFEGDGDEFGDAEE